MKYIGILPILLLVFVAMTPMSFAEDLTIKTNANSYLLGDAVVVSGTTVADSTSVSIQVKDPTAKTILLRMTPIDSSGNYKLEFKIPSSGTEGTYEIIASVISDGIPIIEKKSVLIEEEKPIVQTTRDEEAGEGGGCLIATAAFGSEMVPQVQFLRELRDNTVLQTQSGTSFMTGFNQFYYSFSPAVADLERENPIFKEAVKLTLTPLLTSLTLLNYVDIDTESEMLGYGIGVILLNIGMYFAAPAVLVITIVKRFN